MQASFLDMPAISRKRAAVGRVAQRESIRFTREGSQVQSLSRPPTKLPALTFLNETFVTQWLVCLDSVIWDRHIDAIG
jgi:hypothetical protein